MKRIVSLIFISLLVPDMALAQQHHHGYHDHSRADTHAPIGVMNSHTHQEGEIMFSYLYSNMSMGTNRDGTDDVSDNSVLNNFSVVPTSMTMEMHMFGAMYGVSDELTLMGMVPYIRKAMDHRAGGGAIFETESRGIGDIKLTGLYTVFEEDSEKVHISAGISLPTGSITERDTTPANANAKLPYPMQLGSGTFDPIVGVTYTNTQDDWSWGGQASTIQRFYENSEGYELGEEYNATAWIAKQLTHTVSGSFRLDGKVWGNIDGSDSDLNPAMVPTARTDLRGGERVDALVGVNIIFPELEDNRIAAEIGMPIYERLDGPQLSTDLRAVIAWQWQLPMW